MKLAETAKKVVALAEAIRKYWDRELPKRHPAYPLVNPGEDDGPPPPEEKKLKDFLARLPEDEVYKIALILHLGRRDFGTAELARRYTAMKERFGEPEWAAARMIKAAYADYLSEGLAKLKKAGIDPDHLPLTSVGSPS